MNEVLIRILDYLKEDPIRNCNIIYFAENYPISFYERMGNSVIVKGISDRPWVYISCGDEKELHQLKEFIKDEDKNFAIIENWMIPILTEGKETKWRLSCGKLYLPEEIKIPDRDYRTEPLIESDAEVIYYNSDYKEFLSIEYIKDRIKHGIGSCIKINGNPVAWGITQDDGAIGFLHVMPQHRGKGYAKIVTIDIIHKLRDRGLLPFVHIEESNSKSMPLAQTLGFKFDRDINWFEVL
ncbi:GNAT family N-acetyltransferase [Alkaliphilus serpentinus]|uniref:GNAT family N-acetyltransferase n=1 Tax=Alkaliphilus serpentinus TaxID=1482731 RepID=A0A833HLX0_9FIRM|nr:GNAT family N-acetyltransferase [Alkaliphilus serpentinus]KAB3526761.1 GNAT family N-acetyltransferase [Alkaliphilus serpentinus]